MARGRSVFIGLIVCVSAHAATFDVACTGVDDTSAINAQIRRAVDAGGGVVRLPIGVCVAGGSADNSAVQLHSNVVLEGSGWGSVLRQKEHTQFLIYADSNARYVSDNIRNIVIRNLHVEGPAETPYSPFTHLLSLNGVSDVLIDTVQFSRWVGDAIYIGSGVSAGVERHNERVTVRNALFDGVTRSNRQAVSIIDCDSCTIAESFFTRTTRESEPGAVDVEPDACFNVVRDIRVRDNRFRDIGGNIAAISVFIRPHRTESVVCTLDQQPFSVFITGNQIEHVAAGGISVRAHYDSQHPAETQVRDVIIERNVIIDADYPFRFGGINGLRIRDNSVRETRTPGYIGTREEDGATIFDDGKVFDAQVTGNHFEHIGATSGTGIAVRNVDALTVDGNTFKDWGRHNFSGERAVTFNEAAGTHIRVTNNMFVNTSPLDAVGLYVANYRSNPTTNIASGNLAFGRVQVAALPALIGGAVNSYDYCTLPDDFPSGRWIVDLQSDAGVVPGTLITEKGDSTSAVQWFVPATTSDDKPVIIYVRRAARKGNTWTRWESFKGSFADITTCGPPFP